MQPDPQFKYLDKRFWANVRTISEALGYTNRQTRQIKIYTLGEMAQAMLTIGLGIGHLARFPQISKRETRKLPLF
jgi:hypothetical protein